MCAHKTKHSSYGCHRGMPPDSSVGSLCLQRRRPRFDSWVREIPGRRDRLPTSLFLAFPCGSAGKESSCNAGDMGSILGLGRSPGEGKGYPLQCSGLKNSMACVGHGVTKSHTGLSDFFTFTYHIPHPAHKGISSPSCLYLPSQPKSFCGISQGRIMKTNKYL